MGDRKRKKIETAQELVLLIESNQERFYKVAYSYVKNREDALDIVHDAIVKALQSYHTLRKPEYAQTWFYRILINESISFGRKKKMVVSLDDLSMSLMPSDSESSELCREDYLDLYTAIDRLPADLKTVIILRFFEDMKLDTIAKITSTNLSTTKSRLYRALQYLKLDMEVLEHD